MKPILQKLKIFFNGIVDHPVLVYWCAAFMIAPAGVIVAFFPLNQILGVVGFQVTTVEINSLRALYLFPLIFVSIAAIQKRNWVYALFLLPGLIFISITPDEIGKIEKSRSDDLFNYQKVFNGPELEGRISQLIESFNEGNWISSISPEYRASTIARLEAISANLQVMKALNNYGSKEAIASLRASIEKEKSSVRFEVIDRCKELKLNDKVCSIYQYYEGRLMESIISDLSNFMAASDEAHKRKLIMSSEVKIELELDLAEKLIYEQLAIAKSMPFTLAASIVFAILIYFAGFRSSTLIVLLVCVSSLSIASVQPVPEGEVVDFLLALYPAIVCLASAVVLRFLFRSYLDNRTVIYEFTAKQKISSAFITCLVWLPFPLVIFGILYFNQWIYTAVASAIYCKDGVSCAARFSVYDSDPLRDTLRDDINMAITRQVFEFEIEAIEVAKSAPGKLKDQVQNINTKIMEAFARILPRDIYEINLELKPPKTSDCIGVFYLHIDCFAKKIALEQLNEAYKGPRNNLERKVKGEITYIGAKAVDGVGDASGAILSAVNSESKSAVIYLTKSVDSTFIAFNVFSIFQMAFMLLVVMRSYLLGLGRILYRARKSENASHAPYMTLTHTDSNSISNVGIERYPRTFFVEYKHLPLLSKRSYGADNAYQSTLIFTSFAAKLPIRRLLNGCFFLREITAHDPSTPVRYTSNAGRHFVVWTIPPKAKIFFDLKRFVGMSSNLRLGKEVTLRMGGLTLGTTTHAYATSEDKEGILILESLYGEPDLLHEQTNPMIGAPWRLMSWQDDASFKIVAPDGFINIYLDTPSLDPKVRSRAVLDADGGGSRGLGILTELINLLRP